MVSEHFTTLVPELLASRNDINDDILHLDPKWHHHCRGSQACRRCQVPLATQLAACKRTTPRCHTARSTIVMSGRTAVIAGGGPVCAVTAIMLARQGWKLQVQSVNSLATPSKLDLHRITASRTVAIEATSNECALPLVGRHVSVTQRDFTRANLTRRVLAGVRAGKRSLVGAFPTGQQGLPAEPYLASPQRSEAGPSAYRPYHCKTREASW